MRKQKSLVVGIVCGVVCMIGVYLYVQDAQASLDAQRAEVLAKYGGTQVEVHVATRDIAQGSVADATNTERKLWAGELLPEGAVTDLSQLSSLTAQAPVYKGEVLVQRRFEEQSDQSLQVPDGMCAISVPAKPVSAVGGSVSAGDKVNVYSTSATSTDLIAQGVQVLSTSSSAKSKKSDGSDVSWITLATTSAQVSELIAASNTSDLYFTLPSEDFTVSAASSSDSSSAQEGLLSTGQAGSSASSANSGAQSGENATKDNSKGTANGDAAKGA